MFRRTGPADLTLWWGETPVLARTGDSVAVALLAAGITTTRTTPAGAAPRGPYCLMGACFDCLAEIDGKPNVQTCMTQVRDGMRVRTQIGARDLP